MDAVIANTSGVRRNDAEKPEHQILHRVRDIESLQRTLGFLMGFRGRALKRCLPGMPLLILFNDVKE